jgi:hypothetical protein
MKKIILNEGQYYLLFENENLELDKLNLELKNVNQLMKDYLLKNRTEQDSPNLNSDEAKNLIEKKKEIRKKIQLIVQSNEIKHVQEEVGNIDKNIVRSKVVGSNLDETIEELYPESIYPFLYSDESEFNTNRFKHYIFYEVPELLHTVWRGVNSAEMKFIESNRFIKSNQEMNIGYEVEQGLTVYSKTPNSAISYATSFATDKHKPTENKPNYIIEVKVVDGDGFWVDKNDGYAKTAKSIPLNKISKIYEININKNITQIK